MLTKEDTRVVRPARADVRELRGLRPLYNELADLFESRVILAGAGAVLNAS